MAPLTERRKKMVRYYQRLKSHLDPFACPYCGNSVSPKDFENHCSNHHDFDPHCQCVWCGEKTWGNRKKCDNADHLLDCCLKVIEKPPPPQQQQQQQHSIHPESFYVTDLQHAHPDKEFFGHELDTDAWRQPTMDPSTHLDFFQDFFALTATETIWPMEAEPLPLNFQDESLNLAAAYVQKYLETSETHDWLHLMVKSVAFPSFVRAMDEDRGKTQTLAFFCWCDGGRNELAKHRQHRHMIAVSSPKGRFRKDVWRSVRVDGKKPYPNFSCKKMKPIESPLHLVNTIGYLSQRKSRCNFTIEDRKGPLRMHHFYLNETLPKKFKLPLALLWERGVHQLLYQEKFQNVSIPAIVQHPMTQVGRQWKQQIKHFAGLERGMIVPVDRKWIPTNEVTPFFFHLAEGRKLYFEICSSEDDDQEAWMRKQVQGGNCFYEIVDQELWTPRKRDQIILNYYKPLVDRNKQLESENDSLKRKCEQAETSCKRLREEINLLNYKLNKRSEAENERLKAEIAKLKKKK